MFDSLFDFWVFVLFSMAHYEVKMTMPDALVGRIRLSHRIDTFSYGALLLPILRTRTVNGATGVFCGPREHPNIFQGTALDMTPLGWLGRKTSTQTIFQGTRQHWLIFKENKEINLILGDRNVAILKTHWSVSMHWLYAFVISVGRRSGSMLY